MTLKLKAATLSPKMMDELYQHIPQRTVSATIKQLAELLNFRFQDSAVRRLITMPFHQNFRVLEGMHSLTSKWLDVLAYQGSTDDQVRLNASLIGRTAHPGTNLDAYDLPCWAHDFVSSITKDVQTEEGVTHVTPIVRVLDTLESEFTNQGDMVRFFESPEYLTFLLGREYNGPLTGASIPQSPIEPTWNFYDLPDEWLVLAEEIECGTRLHYRDIPDQTLDTLLCPDTQAVHWHLFLTSNSWCRLDRLLILSRDEMMKLPVGLRVSVSRLHKARNLLMGRTYPALSYLVKELNQWAWVADDPALLDIMKSDRGQRWVEEALDIVNLARAGWLTAWDAAAVDFFGPATGGQELADACFTTPDPIVGESGALNRLTKPANIIRSGRLDARSAHYWRYPIFMRVLTLSVAYRAIKQRIEEMEGNAPIDAQSKELCLKQLVRKPTRLREMSTLPMAMEGFAEIPKPSTIVEWTLSDFIKLPSLHLNQTDDAGAKLRRPGQIFNLGKIEAPPNCLIFGDAELQTEKRARMVPILGWRNQVDAFVANYDPRSIFRWTTDIQDVEWIVENRRKLELMTGIRPELLEASIKEYVDGIPRGIYRWSHAFEDEENWGKATSEGISRALLFLGGGVYNICRPVGYDHDGPYLTQRVEPAGYIPMPTEFIGMRKRRLRENWPIGNGAQYVVDSPIYAGGSPWDQYDMSLFSDLLMLSSELEETNYYASLKEAGNK